MDYMPSRLYRMQTGFKPLRTYGRRPMNLRPTIHDLRSAGADAVIDL